MKYFNPKINSWFTKHKIAVNIAGMHGSLEHSMTSAIAFKINKRKNKKQQLLSPFIYYGNRNETYNLVVIRYAQMLYRQKTWLDDYQLNFVLNLSIKGRTLCEI